MGHHSQHKCVYENQPSYVDNTVKLKYEVLSELCTYVKILRFSSRYYSKMKYIN
jgi:hypothetical protein